jgi:hypothetical protein
MTGRRYADQFHREAEEAARNFEAVKLSLTHKKDGYHLGLVVQPNDMDPDMFTDFIGQRYQIRMVPIGDDEKPIQSNRKRINRRVIAASHTLPKQPEFWDYLSTEIDSFILNIQSEEDAANVLRNYLGIESRSELATNREAIRKMSGVIVEFEHWLTKRDT